MKNKTEDKTENNIVLIAGTFDFFHTGHKKFLNDAFFLTKKLQKLVIIVARDKSVFQIKKFLPTENEKLRKKNIEKWAKKKFPENFLKIEIILGNTKDFLKIPQQINPDIIALGYDQTPPQNFFSIFKNTKIIRLNSYFPEKFKSSIFRKKSENN